MAPRILIGLASNLWGQTEFLLRVLPPLADKAVRARSEGAWEEKAKRLMRKNGPKSTESSMKHSKISYLKLITSHVWKQSNTILKNLKGLHIYQKNISKEPLIQTPTTQPNKPRSPSVRLLFQRQGSFI